jgi:fucose 4-O-acetylase-like acetyltransferase
LFPWAGFVFAGAVVGVAIDRLRRAEHPLRIQLALATASVAIAVAGYAASFLPSIYERSEFWTSSPTFFFLRVGLIGLLLPLAYLWERAPWRGLVSRWSPIEELGRSSLFVYWIHVEMVYGFISRPFRRNLSFEAAVVAYVLFSVFLLALVLLKNRRFRLQKHGPLAAAGPTPASI